MSFQPMSAGTTSAPLQRMGEDVTEKLASARQAGDLMSMLTE
jgi:hypothetical protein